MTAAGIQQTEPPVGLPRAAELAHRLAVVHRRIEQATAAVERPAYSVELLAVTKTVPAADVITLVDLGLCVFGENRVQEGAAKAAEVGALRPDAALRWHVTGRVQRNKARTVARWARRVESVASARLVDALADATAWAQDTGYRRLPLEVLVQLSVDGDPTRGGIPAAELLTLAQRVAGRPELRLAGLMAIAPFAADPEPMFSAIGRAGLRLRAAFPSARVVSAGMSGDLEVAIRHGATQVRIGTALLGQRPSHTNANGGKE